MNLVGRDSTVIKEITIIRRFAFTRSFKNSVPLKGPISRGLETKVDNGRSLSHLPERQKKGEMTPRLLASAFLEKAKRVGTKRFFPLFRGGGLGSGQQLTHFGKSDSRPFSFRWREVESSR